MSRSIGPDAGPDGLPAGVRGAPGLLGLTRAGRGAATAVIRARVAAWAASLAAVLMSCAAPAAWAGERMIEVWNPPEARASAPHGAAHVVMNRALPHRKKISVAHRMPVHPHRLRTNAAPAAAALTASRAHVAGSGTLAQPAHDPARFDEIPRIVTPEGNILRVGSGHARALVAH
jgi:hypothetical protein